MKTILKLAFVLNAGFAFAQSTPSFPIEKDKDKMIEKLTTSLGLSTVQVNQVKAIEANYDLQEEALKQQFEALKEQRKALREAKKAEIDQILTLEQRAKLETLKAERKAKMKERKGEIGEKMKQRRNNN